jgi:hypothetical protein
LSKIIRTTYIPAVLKIDICLLSCLPFVSKIGKNNNTCTVQAESSKFASVLFDQEFQIWLIGTDWNAIWRCFVSIRLYLALLFIMSICNSICTYIFDILSAPEIKTDEEIYVSKSKWRTVLWLYKSAKQWRHENWDVLHWRAIYFALKDFMVLAHKKHVRRDFENTLHKE